MTIDNLYQLYSIGTVAGIFIFSLISLIGFAVSELIKILKKGA